MRRTFVTVMPVLLLAAGCGGPEKALIPEEQLKANVRGVLEQVAPEGWLDLSEEGTRLRGEKKYDDAIAVFEKGIKAYPEYPEAYKQLAMTLDESSGMGSTLDAATRKARQEAALRHYETLLTLDPTSSTARNRVIGLYLYDLERPADAERAARAWTQAAPESSEGWDALTDVLMKGTARTGDATRALLDAASKVKGGVNQEFVALAMQRVAKDDATVPDDRAKLLDAAVRLVDEALKETPGDTRITRIKMDLLDAKAAAAKAAAK